jgi:hypothetical protein
LSATSNKAIKMNVSFEEESNNNNMINDMSFDYDCEDDEVEVEVVLTSTKVNKYFPHMKILFTKHSDAVFKIFKAVDEFDCTSELKANNGNNTKGNNWNKLYDNFYGGNSPGRGLLAPYSDILPKIGTVTQLKNKIKEMWTYAKKESTNSKSDANKECLLMGVRQAKEYDEASAKEKAAIEKQKLVNEKLQKDMGDYEASTGALPPGVKGMVGGGRQQHSTNLHTLQPASMAYANATTQGDNDDGVIDLAKTVVTPKSDKKQKGKPNKAKGGGTVNNSAVAVWEKITDNLSNGLDRLAATSGGNGKVVDKKKSKLDLLKEQLNGLKDSISFCKDIPGLEDQYVAEMEEYKATLKKIKEEQKKVLLAAEEKKEREE